MKKILITGASRGIGRACAILAARQGYEVGITYNTNEKAASEVKSIIDSITKCHVFQADFSNTEKIEELSKKIFNEMGEIDCLVNNAGSDLWGLFQDVKSEEFDKLLNIDFKSVYFLTKEISNSMIKRKEGSIVNVSSVWGETGASCEVLYSSIKGAVISFSKALAKELAPSGIRVNSVSPGICNTDMMKRFSEEEREELEETVPLSRFAEPREIAEVVLFLISEKASYITGQDIGVNGGMYC